MLVDIVNIDIAKDLWEFRQTASLSEEDAGNCRIWIAIVRCTSSDAT